MKYFNENEYGLYYIKNNKDKFIRLFTGVKVINSDFIYFPTLNECFNKKEVINIFENSIGHDIYMEKNSDKFDFYHHNRLVVNHDGEESVVAEFLSLNANARKMIKVPDYSCTFGMLLRNERNINRNLKKFFKAKIKEMHEEKYTDIKML